MYDWVTPWLSLLCLHQHAGVRLRRSRAEDGMNPRVFMWSELGSSRIGDGEEEEELGRGWVGLGRAAAMGRKRSSFATSVVAGILACIAAEHVTFPGHAGRIELSGVIYKPHGYGRAPSDRYAAMVMMHGCSGIWSERVVGATNRDGTPNLQNNIKKWGVKLAESNVVALAVDSFTPRMPDEVTSSEDWQNQCSDNAGRYAGAVSPYTDRVLDARAAWDFLSASPEIDGSKIGLLGWSHGAQAVMVEAAETGRFSDVPREVSDHKFVCSVAFYPGCGENLGFGTTPGAMVATSIWRPFRPMQLHMGMCDPFYSNCLARANMAPAPGRHVPLLFSAYPGARHHFDALSQAWPSSLTTTTTNSSELADDDDDHGLCADRSAMLAADVAALDFFLSALA